jgi:antitoxin component of MazEF toxin-antitoxin module
MTNKQKIIKTGNSLGLTLPARVVHALGLKPSDDVSVTVAPDLTSITYTFDQPRQLSLTQNETPKI